MANRTCRRRELLERWRGIEEEEDDDDPPPSKQRQIRRTKDEWFSDTFNHLISSPKETHIWCGCWELMGPLLETFHNYFEEKHDASPLKLIWERISREMRECTQCICQHHQAQEMYSTEYEPNTVGPLLTVLRILDEERITEHLKDLNGRITRREYDLECYNAEVVSIMFEVLMYPILLDDQSLVKEFQIFIEAIDNSHELTLAGQQQYPGVYALLFLKSGRARAIGLRLAGCMGNLRRAKDLEPLQPLLKRCIGILEADVMPPTLETSRPRLHLERVDAWLGIKTLLGFLEPSAFEEGIMERYPVFLSIVLNHVSDDTVEFTYAVACLKSLFEMLGCKLWLKTTFSSSVMRNTLLGQCFHIRNEKSHNQIFDLFQPFLQSLEALQDGEHEKQRRHLLYFLLHQVTQSRNFSPLMRQKARKIAFLIIHRGYKMNPPCPPFECAHMWGPPLLFSLKDSSLHNSLQQPAFDLIQTIIVSDAAALISLRLKDQVPSVIGMSSCTDLNDGEDEILFAHASEGMESTGWTEISVQSALAFQESKEWFCVPMLWINVMFDINPITLPISFSKAVLWGLSRFPMMELESNIETTLPIKDWLSLYADQISASFGWEVPRGSDDGGDGMVSRNSVKASAMLVPLIRTFKRCAASFVIQMEKAEFQKQCTWEPKMAESLILLLIDPNDSVRQAVRVLLEYFSKTRGLTSSLQFLCSSASSLSAVYLGMKCAMNMVQIDSVFSNFHNLHHLFFIGRKLLKEVVSSPQKLSNKSDELNNSNFSSEGGFLRQPILDHLPVTTPDCSPNIMDMRSWEKFSCLLSRVMWPSMLKCLAEGKAFLNSKSSQMTCVRFLEVLPVVYERLRLSEFTESITFKKSVPDFANFNWLNDLLEWGSSSLLVINRHWRLSLTSLLNLFKHSCDTASARTVGVIEKIISCDTVAINVLREQVSQLSVSLSEQISDIIETGVCKKKPSFLEPLPPETKGSAARSYLNDLPNKSCRNEVIVVSDDEGENVASPKAVGLSGSEINQQGINEIGLASADMSIIGNNDQGGPLRSTVPRNLSKNIVTEVAGNSRFSSQKPDNEVPGTDHLSSAISSKSRFSSQKLGNEVIGTDHLSSTLTSSIGARDRSLVCDNRKSDSAHQSSIQFVASKSSDKLARNSSTVVDQEKEDALIKELISDKSDDPLDMALNNARHPTPMLTKPSASVPKRKVIQLQMPIENKSAYLRKLNSIVKRFKPPKLDEWYKPILEIDYFSVVGLSSLHDGEHSSKTNLKEVPLYFQSADHYVEIFRPLVLEEFKAQLRNSYMEISSLEEMFCGSICVLSVEKIDEFHLLRCLPDDQESIAFRGCSENDLVLLSKEPLKHSAQNLHVVGKVERREKSHKSRSSILVIRLYLPNSLLRLNKVNRLLIERSKWFVTRIMSITPQLREFQALSSIKDIPLLPVILNPTGHSVGHSDNSKVEISMLSQPMQQTLISSFNESQLRAIGIAIATCDLKKISELSLIQGPPGTGKTKTIVAIVSGLLALGGSRKNALKDFSNTPRDSSTSRMRISQSAAIARAWQDAAYAKQLAKDGEKDYTVSTENSTRARVLICAQSNAAVDELVSRITGGIFGNDGKFYKPYLVRVGNVKTVHPASSPFFIDTLVEQRLAEDGTNENGPKIETGRDSSQSLRAKLEKLMDSIRFYESMRANGKLDTKASEDGPLKVDDVGHEISDEALGAKLKILYGQKKAIYADLAAVQAREKKSSDEIKALKHNMRRSILREAEIVVTTLSGCGGDLYGVCSDSASRCGNLSEHSLFDAVVIDEAAQALEPATLIPLQLLKSSRTKCIMVGDPKQLPATVLSNLASKFLYQCSMFERLQRAGYPVTMLTDQYRMHPEICRFPSLHFYENKLRDGVLMASKSATFHENVCLGPFVFFDIVDGHEYHGKDSGSLSLCNDSEADAAVEITRFFKKRYSSDFLSRKIGIITPYKRQLTLLRSRFTSAFGSDAIADLEFNTIDGFQGREVDILMLSTVRASDLGVKASGNQSSGIGFVADVRRMNVALTRAKLSLWIVGNARTLQTNIHWDALINNAKERKLLMSIGRPYGSIFTKSPSSFKRNLSSNSDSLRSINQGSKVKESRHCLTITEQEVVQPMPSSAVECSTGEHVAGNEGKIYKAKRRRDNKEGAMQSVKEKTMGHHKSSPQNGKPVKTGSATKTSSKMAKDPAESSEHGTTGEVMRGDIASSHDSSHQVNEVAGMEHVPKNLVATRKRQRDAVDALLSSALISSKTSKTSLKSDPGKKALSSTMGAKVNIKPPKLIKDPPTSPKSQVQEMVSGTAIPPQTRHHSSRHKNSGKKGKDARIS